MKIIDILNQLTPQKLYNQWNDYYPIVPVELHQIEDLYNRLINKELLPSDNDITVEYYRSVDDEYHSVFRLIDGERVSISFEPWGSILNSELDNQVDEPNEDVIIHILYEMTWNGWTDERVIESREQLERKVEEMERDNGRLYTLEELDLWINYE
jgi:hypothetical protein